MEENMIINNLQEFFKTNGVTNINMSNIMGNMIAVVSPDNKIVNPSINYDASSKGTNITETILNGSINARPNLDMLQALPENSNNQSISNTNTTYLFAPVINASTGIQNFRPFVLGNNNGQLTITPVKAVSAAIANNADQVARIQFLKNEIQTRANIISNIYNNETVVKGSVNNIPASNIAPEGALDALSETLESLNDNQKVKLLKNALINNMTSGNNATMDVTIANKLLNSQSNQVALEIMVENLSNPSSMAAALSNSNVLAQEYAQANNQSISLVNDINRMGLNKIKNMTIKQQISFVNDQLESPNSSFKRAFVKNLSEEQRKQFKQRSVNKDLINKWQARTNPAELLDANRQGRKLFREASLSESRATVTSSLVDLMTPDAKGDRASVERYLRQPSSQKAITSLVRMYRQYPMYGVDCMKDPKALSKDFRFMLTKAQSEIKGFVADADMSNNEARITARSEAFTSELTIKRHAANEAINQESAKYHLTNLVTSYIAEQSAVNHPNITSQWLDNAVNTPRVQASIYSALLAVRSYGQLQTIFDNPNQLYKNLNTVLKADRLEQQKNNKLIANLSTDLENAKNSMKSKSYISDPLQSNNEARINAYNAANNVTNYLKAFTSNDYISADLAKRLLSSVLTHHVAEDMSKKGYDVNKSLLNKLMVTPNSQYALNMLASNATNGSSLTTMINDPKLFERYTSTSLEYTNNQNIKSKNIAQNEAKHKLKLADQEKAVREKNAKAAKAARAAHK